MSNIHDQDRTPREKLTTGTLFLMAALSMGGAAYANEQLTAKIGFSAAALCMAIPGGRKLASAAHQAGWRLRSPFHNIYK